MSVWNVSNGSWGVSGNWTGGIPDASGAVATFDFSASGSNTNSLISLEDGTDRSVGVLNISASATHGMAIKALNTATSATLRFAATGGVQAAINADGNGNGSFEMLVGNGFHLVLDSNTLVNTINSDTIFTISAPISGSGQLVKQGTGTLVLEGAHSFSGGLDIGRGTVEIGTSASLGSGGPLTMHGGALLVTGTTVIAADVLAYGSSSATHLNAATSRTITLTGSTFTMLSNSRFSFGSDVHNGTIVLSVGAAHIGLNSSLDVDGGTVTFGDAANARDFFHFAGTGLVQLAQDGTLDTAGFATRISNLDFDGGTLTSTSGVLDVLAGYTNAQSDNIGTVIATAGADRLVLIAKAAQNLNFSQLSFSGWSDANDTITFAGSTGNDIFTGTTQADRMFGNLGSDTMTGGSGNDLLNGQGGVDSMAGGLGDDAYIVDSIGETITETLGQGDDRVTSSVDFILPDHVERLTLVGAARNGTGNALDNFITGSNGSDTLLSGLGGVDAISGLLGNDILDGGAGEDVLIGGAGKDTLTGGADRDRFTFFDGDMNATRGTADIITDFNQALDERIALNNVDANEALGGMQALKFIGTAAFSGAAGELRYVQASGNTYLEGNTDSDLVADFMIRLNGLYTLDITDFNGVTL